MMNIELTEAAIKELKKVKEEQSLSEDKVVRVSVAGGGCSGFQYQLAFDEAENIKEKEDHVFEFDNIKVIVDKRSMLYLDGTTLGFHEDLSKRGFVFDNPQANRTCGCGMSFNA